MEKELVTRHRVEGILYACGITPPGNGNAENAVEACSQLAETLVKYSQRYLNGEEHSEPIPDDPKLTRNYRDFMGFTREVAYAVFGINPEYATLNRRIQKALSLVYNYLEREYYGPGRMPYKKVAR